MGWKTFKERFSITHLVSVTEEGICIGSSYVSALVVVNPETGKVTEDATFRGFLKEHYPELSAASPDEILQAIRATDSFTTSIPVFTYQGSQILEKHCEKMGWPNVTHDGCLMYKNLFFDNRHDAQVRAREEALARLKEAQSGVKQLQEELLRGQAYLAECLKTCTELAVDTTVGTNR